MDDRCTSPLPLKAGKFRSTLRWLRRPLAAPCPIPRLGAKGDTQPTRQSDSTSRNAVGLSGERTERVPALFPLPRHVRGVLACAQNHTWYHERCVNICVVIIIWVQCQKIRKNEYIYIYIYIRISSGV